MAKGRADLHGSIVVETDLFEHRVLAALRQDIRQVLASNKAFRVIKA